MKSRRRRSPAATGAPFLHRIESLTQKVDPTTHPFNTPRLLSRNRSSPLRSKVTFFVGENGSGKSTLLEAIGGVLRIQSRGRQPRPSPRHLRAIGSPLAQALRLSWRPKVTEGFFLRAESFYDFATYLDAGLRTCSPTAASRCTSNRTASPSSPCSPIASSRASTSWTQPEAALSPQRQLSLLKIVHDLATPGHAQFLIATHSPIHPRAAQDAVAHSTSTGMPSGRPAIARPSTSSSPATSSMRRRGFS